MQTRYRILGADGAPEFEGKRSRVREKLLTKRYRDRWGTIRIEVCRYEPQHEDCPKWALWGNAMKFMESQ